MRSQFMNILKAAIASLLVLAQAACVAPAREDLNSLAELGSEETIIVGKVELVPALKKNEQRIQGLTSANFENKIFILADDHYREFKSEPEVADYAGRIEATLGSNFFVRSSNKTFYLLGGMMYLKLGGPDSSRAYFPGNLKVAINRADKAIYIGTLQYHRDEFFNISKVSVIDEYDKANAEFRKKFGSKFTLRKALLTASR